MTGFRLGRFTVFSGIGWCIDFAIFTSLVRLGLASMVANLISASVAVTFVFVTSRRWIFRHHAGSLGGAIGRYVAWNVVAITAASLAIRLLVALLASPSVERLYAMLHPTVDTPTLIAITAKILLTPFTMYANFLAMGYILERRLTFL